MFLKLTIPKSVSKELDSILPRSTSRFTKVHSNSFHLSILYVGKNSDKKKDEIISNVETVCRNQPLLQARLGGIGYFRLMDGSVVTYASVNSPGLDLLRANLFMAVNPVCKVPNTYGFNAHITLYHGQAPVGIINKLPNSSWTFEGIRVCSELETYVPFNAQL